MIQPTITTTTAKSYLDDNSQNNNNNKNKKYFFMNRYQTDEWKGWMQIYILLFNYYNARDFDPIVQIMLKSYLFMTGYGHYQYFVDHHHDEITVSKFLQTLWRINIVSFCLCWTQKTPYILYYPCLIHSFFYITTYVTMQIGKQVSLNTKFTLQCKLQIVTIILFLLFEINSIPFQIINSQLLGTRPQIGPSTWQMGLQNSLDFWPSLMGMIVAYNVSIINPIISQNLERKKYSVWVLYIGKFIIASILIAVLALMYHLQQQEHQQLLTSDNKSKSMSLIAFLSIVVYIYLRNMTPYLQGHYINVFRNIGTFSLEAYLLHHHILLTGNGSHTLTLLQGYPKLNFLLVSFLFVCMCWRLHKSIHALKTILFPDNINNNNCRQCFQRLTVVFCAIVVIISVMALCLYMTNTSSIEIYMSLALLCGFGIYQIMINVTTSATSSGVTTPTSTTTTSSRNGANYNNNSNSNNQHKLYVKFVPPFVGLGSVLLLYFACYQQILLGVPGGTIQPNTSVCRDYVNTAGLWVPIDTCNEQTTGSSYRNFGISPPSICSPEHHAYIWAWQYSNYNQYYCRFYHRDSKSLQVALNQKRLIFIGDSITRFLYHALCRQMGMVEAGYYNATGTKHEDIHRMFGETLIEFQWAAYATDQIARINNITINKETLPDLIVLGGGAWDRLWKYNNDTEKQALQDAVGQLAQQIHELQLLHYIKVVWVIPTTINTPALKGPDKQANIHETAMEGIRVLYQKMGVLEAASLVIDGPSFTASRVSESTDGVHYPNEVYNAGAQILANSLDWLLPTTNDFDNQSSHYYQYYIEPVNDRLSSIVIFILLTLGIWIFDILQYASKFSNCSVLPNNSHPRLGDIVGGGNSSSCGPRSTTTGEAMQKMSTLLDHNAGNVVNHHDEESTGLLQFKDS